MQITTIALHALRMPLVAPFTTSFGTQVERYPLIVELHGTVTGPDGAPVDAVGWGECVSGHRPEYSSEYVDGSREVMTRYLAPLLYAAQRTGRLTSGTVQEWLRPIVGHPMAKAALEMAVLDAELRARGVSLAEHLGAVHDRVPSGVSVGIQKSVPELIDVVSGYLDSGYVRIKLKIRPGFDIEPVRAVRERFPDIPLQVDANAAYTLADVARLRPLDDLGLLLIEQPLAEDDILQHARLAEQLRTPICLDESIVSAESAAAAIALRATSVINVKPGRVGGYLEARRIHDIARANGIPVWCGGMLETGIGRAANAALAALAGFTLPGDISASDRFYATDITEPFTLQPDGTILVPDGPGLGVAPIPDVLAAFTVDTREVRP
ncbi:MAG: o-succinylbenzoate synthase [Mycobacteriales bacterium]